MRRRIPRAKTSRAKTKNEIRSDQSAGRRPVDRRMHRISYLSKEGCQMADKETNGRVVETIEEATQAERSPDTFYILIISLVAMAVVGAFLLWYFGVFPG